LAIESRVRTGVIPRLNQAPLQGQTFPNAGAPFGQCHLASGVSAISKNALDSNLAARRSDTDLASPIEPMVPPVFSRKQGDFQEKQGGDLSTNGQSLRGIRDLDDFSKSK
jgi:hypothetical protein